MTKDFYARTTILTEMRIKKIELKEIIDFLGEEIIGISGDYTGKWIDNMADASHITTTSLDWINPSKPDKQAIAVGSRAKVLITDCSIASVPGKVLIKVKAPKRAIAMVGNRFFADRPTPGIHSTAVIHSEAVIGENVAIGPYSVIGKARIGEGTIIASRVRIHDDVVIGRNCSVKDGAVIGGEGFGFETDEKGNRFRFPQIGGVVIGDQVEIGANTCIDRGALSDTIVEDYSKIDNLCHIAHNVVLGKNTVVVSGAVLCGSSRIGESSWIGPNAVVRDQISIGRNVILGMGAVAAKNVKDDDVRVGNPSKSLIY